MSDKRTEDGFPHSPDPVPGVDARITTDGQTGDVTVSFGDGSDDLKVDRREFMRISGVAAATAAMAGAACRNPVEKIVPYVDRPEKIRIGMPNYYASICNGCPSQCGALVQTRVGRPIKLEGNPQHPIGKGGLCARGQASYMDLYDPSRAKAPQKIGSGDTTWEELDKAVSDAIGSAKSVHVLTGSLSSPSLLQLIRTAGNGLGGKVKHHQFDAINEDAAHAVSEKAYGKAHVPHYRFDKADLIVSLGADFLGTWLSPVEFTKQFTSRRNPDGDMNRMVAFEPTMTLTGMNADDRYPVRAADLPAIAMALAHVVVVEKNAGPLAGGSAAGALQAFTPAAVAEATGVAAETLTALGGELADHVGTSLVVSGGTTDSTELHAAVTLLNAALGSDDATIERMRASKQANGRTSELQALIKEMNAGNVDVLIIDGTNPVYSAPSLGFADALGKVKTVVSTADRVDETAEKATYLAPTTHFLESWGDAEQLAGVYSLQQPTLQPLANTRSFGNSLIAWFAPHVADLQAFQKAPELPAANRPGANYPTESGAYYRFMRAHWKKSVFAQSGSLASFDRFWSDTLATGSYRHPNGRRIVRGVQMGGLTGLLPKAMPEKAAGGAGDLSSKELQLVATVQLYDGRQANNGHLQELPDPITKHVWGSYVTVGPKTFKEAGFEAQGEWIEVTVGEAKHRFQVIMQPGQHEGVIAVPLGYGRTAAGDVGSDVGVNTFDFAGFGEDGVQQLGGLAASASKTGEGEQIAIVQGAQVLDTHRRPIQSFTTLPEYKEDKAAGVNSHPPLPDMWGSHDYKELKWGMSVDLTKCTGCSACVTACQEENNIPVVGRRGILEGREMHWMRIDRYYHLPPEAAKLQKSATADPMFAREPVVAFGDYMDNPRVTAQPMMCQHCEHAPCETVCPVSATMHSEDGLNQMAYNRCVGTRYCSNNCPFKVRRFNWFNYVTDRADTVIARLYNMVEDGLLEEHGRMNAKEPMQLGRNPDVTVRARGVMEKCTFCVQRIRRAGVQMRKEGRTKVRDGDVITACQQSCPADAIVFGNLSDENSAVAKLHAKKRALSPLQEVGVHSSVAYLTSVFHSNSQAYIRPDHHGGHGEDDAHEGNAADHG